MTPILSYLLKVNIVVIVLYGFYFLCFRRDTFYGHIRWYFLTTIASAIIFPLIDISAWLTGSPAAMSVSQYIPNVDAVYQYLSVQSKTLQIPQIEYNIVEPTITHVLPFGLILLWCWLIIAFFLLGKRLFQLGSIVRLWYCYPRQNNKNSAFIAIDRSIQPFSFFGRIFLNPVLYSKDELDEIVTHEHIHCQQGHTIDNLLAEVLVCLCWFNPIIWLLRNDLKQNLEYHTDRMTLRSGFNRKHYQYSLLRIAGNAFQIANHFHFNHLKKRIIMLNKKESPRIMTAKYLLAVPALAAALLTVQASGLQAAKEYSNDSASALVEHTELSDRNIDTTFTKKEDNSWVAYRGSGMVSLDGDVTTIQSDSIVIRGNPFSNSLILIDGKEGSPKDISPQNIAKMELFKNEAATNRYGSRGENGVVLITTKKSETHLKKEPIQLPDSGKLELLGHFFQNIDPALSLEPQTLIFLDGKRITREEMNKIDKSTIESFSILKNASAIAVYGKEAKDGVILITLKKGMNPAQGIIRNGSVLSETIQVSGTVTSAEGKPLPGVAVMVKDMTTGTVTDMNGQYSLAAPANVTLKFSFVGMATQEIIIGNQQVINVVMASQPEENVEVRIRGMEGMQGSRPLYIVDGKELDNLNCIDPNNIKTISVLKDRSATALYGEKAKDGVIIISSKNVVMDTDTYPKDVGYDGVMKSATSATPLFIVDGKEVDDNFKLNSIDPKNIESIDILKDQSAIAKYGEKGKNGVVIINLTHFAGFEIQHFTHYSVIQHLTGVVSTY